MHESGTGGAPKYGLIPQMPLTSVESPVNLLDNLTYSQPRVCMRLSLKLNESSSQKVGWQRLRKHWIFPDLASKWCTD